MKLGLRASAGPFPDLVGVPCGVSPPTQGRTTQRRNVLTFEAALSSTYQADRSSDHALGSQRVYLIAVERGSRRAIDLRAVYAPGLSDGRGCEDDWP